MGVVQQTSGDKTTVSIYIDSRLAELSSKLPKGAVSRIAEEGLRAIQCRQSWRLTGDVLMGMVIISLGGLFIVLSTLFSMAGVGNPLVMVPLLCIAVILLSVGIWVIFRDLSATSGFARIIEEVSNNGHADR